MDIWIDERSWRYSSQAFISAAMVETGEIELSEHQDIGVGDEDKEPSMTLEELRARLSEVSVPIEEYIRGERTFRFFWSWINDLQCRGL